MSNRGLCAHALQKGPAKGAPLQASLPLWPEGACGAHLLRGAISSEELGRRPLPADDALDGLPVAPLGDVLLPHVGAAAALLAAWATREASSSKCGGTSGSPRVPTRRVLRRAAAARTAGHAHAHRRPRVRRQPKTERSRARGARARGAGARGARRAGGGDGAAHASGADAPGSRSTAKCLRATTTVASSSLARGTTSP